VRVPKIRAADARVVRGIQKVQLWHTEYWQVDFPFQPSLTSARGGVKNHNSLASGEELLFERHGRGCRLGKANKLT